MEQQLYPDSGRETERQRDMWKQVQRMMKKHKRTVSAAAGISILLVLILCVPQLRWAFLSVVSSEPVCRECGDSHVIHDYYTATGISLDTLGALPEEVVEIYGEPDYIQEEPKGGELLSQRYHYDGFAIMFDSRNPAEVSAEDCRAVGFIIYSPEMEIRRDIRVGSARKQIIYAYRKCPTMTVRYAEVNDEELGDSVIDGNSLYSLANFLNFNFNEDGLVSSIEYYPGIRYLWDVGPEKAIF